MRKLLSLGIICLFLLSFLSSFSLIVEAEIVTVTNEDNPIQNSVQEKTFLWNGRVYVFYSNGVNMAYKHRTNGTGWSSEIEIRTAIDGNHFSVWLEEDGINAYIHYAYSANLLTDENVYYRKGKLLLDGVIYWLATEKTILWQDDPIFGSGKVDYPYVATDSDGYPVIVAHYFTPAGDDWDKTWVRRSSKKDGTWATDMEYGWRTVTCSPPYFWSVNKIIPIQSRKFHVISVRADGTNRDYYYNGASWSFSEDPLREVYACENQFQWGGVAENGKDVIHVVYNRFWLGDYFFQHRKWNSSGWFWIDPPYEGIGNYTWSLYIRPTLALNSSDNTMRAMWLEYNGTSFLDNTIWYRDWNGTGWGTPTLWITETDDIIEHEDFNAIYSASNFYGITYITNATSKNIEFEHFPEIPGQSFLINITIYEDDSILSNLKLVKIDSSYYETSDRAWLLEGNHTLSFSPIGYDFFNWTVSGSISVLNNQSQSTTLTVNGEGTLTLYLKPIFLTWFMRRTLMWLGLIGIFICILCPVVAFTKIKGKDLEGGAMWFLGVFVLGIPFIVAWLWG